MERHRPRGDRPYRGRPRQAVRVPPRLSGQCARPRLRLQPLGAALDEGQRARRVRARRGRGGVPREARPSVLVLLPVQRLQQHARGRLGDDPARLRRTRRSSRARGRSGRDRLQLARGSRACSVGRREARARRVTARRLPRRRLPRQQVLGRALAGQLGGGRGRLRRHARAAPRAVPAGRHDPERPGGRRGRISVDRLRGALGRAPEGVLQRPDRPEPEDAVDEADHVVRGLARRELRGADGRRVRHGDDRLLLLRGRDRLEGTRAVAQQPASARHCHRCGSRPRDLRGRTCDLDAGRAAADRAATVVGSDHLGVGEDVRQTTGSLPRAGRAPRSHCGRHHLRAVAAARRARPHRERVG